MRLVHFSDIHFGRELPAVVDGLLRRLSELNPDAVAASGDFTMAGRRREYAAAAAFLGRIQPPVIATPGNHDIPAYDLPARFLTPLGRYNQHIAALTLDRFVNDDVALLALNSARPWGRSVNWSHGRLSKDQIDEADAFFAEHTDHTFRALVTHHPFCVPSDLPGFRPIGNGDLMLRTLARHRVHAVLTGHLHRHLLSTRRLEYGDLTHEIVFVHASTVASSRHRAQPNAFAVIEADQGGVRVYPEVWDGARFAPGDVPATLPAPV